MFAQLGDQFLACFRISSPYIEVSHVIEQFGWSLERVVAEKKVMFVHNAGISEQLSDQILRVEVTIFALALECGSVIERKISLDVPWFGTVWCAF